MKAIEGVSPMVSTLEETFACKRDLTPSERRNVELDKVPITMEVSKSILEDKGRIILAYDGTFGGPWNHLDTWHMKWGNDLTCFSSL